MQGPSNDPNPAGALLARAEILLDLGRPAEALPLLQKAATLAPDDCNPHCWMALAQFRLGRHAEALQAAGRGVTLAPDYEWPHRLRSIILRDQRKFGPALEAAQTTVRLAPDEQNALHLLATCQVDRKQYSQAYETGLRLREVAPEWDSTHTLLGNLAIHLKRWNEAEDHCRRALELNPQARKSLYNLGYICHLNSRKREAADYYHAVLRIDPADPDARQALFNLVSRDMAQLPIWLRKKRLAEEHPTVQAFITEENERSSREVSRALSLGWLIFAWVFTSGWTLFVLASLRFDGILHHWWEWLAYFGTVGATLWGTYRWARKRRQIDA